MFKLLTVLVTNYSYDKNDKKKTQIKFVFKDILVIRTLHESVVA